MKKLNLILDDLSSVSSFANAFEGCSNLKEIKIESEDYNTNYLRVMTNMF